MVLVPTLDTSAFDEFLGRLEAATDLRSESAFAEGCLDASDVYMEAMRERFDLYSLRGGDWAEHAPMTIAKRGADAPILYETGQMRRSLDRSEAEHVLEVDESQLIEGTDNDLARIHQSGTDRIPARPFIVPPEGDTLEQMKDQVVYGLQTAAKDAARGY